MHRRFIIFPLIASLLLLFLPAGLKAEAGTTALHSQLSLVGVTIQSISDDRRGVINVFLLVTHGLTRPFRPKAAQASGAIMRTSFSISSATISISRCGCVG